MESSSRNLEPQKRASTSNNGIDRISLLPDDILCHILSFLDTFDMSKTSLLSRRWAHLWAQVPIVDINNETISKKNMNSDDIRSFVKWVFYSQGLSSKILRFRVDCMVRFQESDIRRWFQVLARRNVEEIDLATMLGPTFELPYCLVTCESLRVFKLKLIFNSLVLPAYQGFRQLETLQLMFVHLPDEDLTRSFISSCPVLRTLKLLYSIVTEFKVLDVSSASIKYLTIEGLKYSLDDNEFSLTDIKISCPQLLFFHYVGPVARNYFLENVSSLEHFTVCITNDKSPTLNEHGARLVSKFLHEIRNVKVLKFCDYFLMRLYSVLDDLRCCSLPLNGLTSLKLCLAMEDCYIQTTIFLLRSFPHLPSLTVFFEKTKFSIYSSEKKVDLSQHQCKWSEYQVLLDEGTTCLMSHCKLVEIIDFKGAEDEIEFIRFILKNGLVLEKLIISWVSLVSEKYGSGILHSGFEFDCKSITVTDINDIILRLPRSSPDVAVTIHGPVQVCSPDSGIKRRRLLREP